MVKKLKVMDSVPFWESKSLAEMSRDEWESLCDGCGKCCLHKLQDEETEELLFTCISCQYLDTESCRCTVYATRNEYVPDCLNLSAENLAGAVEWLPATCAYRLLSESKALPVWHPLICGSEKELHVQQISVRNKAVSELSVDEEDWQDYVI